MSNNFTMILFLYQCFADIASRSEALEVTAPVDELNISKIDDLQFLFCLDIDDMELLGRIHRH